MKNLNNKISSIILLFLIFALTHQQALKLRGAPLCDDTTSPPLIQTGTFSLTRQSNRISRVNTFQIVVNYAIPSNGFNVAVSTGRINAYSQSVGTDYSIRGARQNQTNIANFILLINSDISWSTIQASFLISSRADLLVGSFMPDTQSLFISGAQSLTTQHQLTNWVPFSGNITFAVLISGLRTADTFFNTSITQVGFSAQNGLFTLTINSNANPSLQMIYLTYVILLGNSPFTFVQYNPLINTPTSTYSFEGIDSFSGNNIAYEGYAINYTASQSTIPCYGSNCQSACIAPITCNSLSGIIFFNQCFLCGFQQTYVNGQCLARCSGNETWSGSSCVCKAGYTRVNGVCRIINCGLNEFFNGVQCVCVSGFQRVNSVCRNITCPTNQTFNGTDCVCLQGYQRIGSVCQLISCPASSFWNGQQCVCNQGYIKIGLSCFFQCTSNGYLNQNGSCVCLSGYTRNTLGQCVTVACGSNQVFDPSQSKCVCRSGTLFSRNQCLPRCANFDNAVIFQGTCVCIQGYDVSNGICVKLPTCSKDNQVFVNGSCTCRAGYQYNSLGLCIPNCLQNQVLVNQGCQCVVGFSRNSSGVCVRTCSTNQVLVSGSCQCIRNFVRLFSGQCVSTCPINEYNLNGNCVCINTFTRNTQGVCTKICGLNQVLQGLNCVCADGFIRNSNGVCNIRVPICGQNQFLNGTICQCNVGFIRQNSVCVSVCRINEIYDSALKGCICRDGYGLSPATNLCDICPPNSKSTGLLTGCVCITGYIWNTTSQKCQVIICPANSSLSQSGECVCNSGFYLDSNQCKKVVTCPARSTWDSTKLICICTVNGQYLINGTCQTCQSNSAWNGTQCVCRTGFFLISNVCTQCSSNSQYIRGQCICNFGFFGNGTTCNACHLSCGTCRSGLSNDCLTCANASYTLTNGQCTLKACDTGYFLNPTTTKCQMCIEYCATCRDTASCDTCISGFQIQTVIILPITTSKCVQICGDGKKFYDQCDDNNTVSGDGCSNICQVQNGWTCVGGNTTNKSTCYNILPSASKLITNGHVVLQGQVLQGMSLSYIPSNLTNGGCTQCSNLLRVSVLSSPIIPIVTVNYISSTQYKFVINFDFNRILGSFVFNFTVKLNPSFSSYFTQADMDQIEVVTIDMALLSQVDATDSLSIGNLQTNDLTVQSNSNNRNSNIVIPGVPAAAVSILFPDN